MGFDNDYPNRKDWRKRDRWNKSRWRRCGCDWCLRGHTHSHARRQPADQILTMAEYRDQVDQLMEDMWVDLESDDAVRWLATELNGPMKQWSFDIYFAERSSQCLRS